MYVLAYYLTSIYLLLRAYEELSSLLQLVNGICEGRTALHGYH